MLWRDGGPGFRQGCRFEAAGRAGLRIGRPAPAPTRGAEAGRGPAASSGGDRQREPGALLLWPAGPPRSEEHTSELQSLTNLVCRLLLEKKKQKTMRSKY